jgi:hypothetical protein
MNDNELERIWKEAIVKILFRHLTGTTEGTQEIPQSENAVFRPRSEYKFRASPPEQPLR